MQKKHIAILVLCIVIGIPLGFNLIEDTSTYQESAGELKSEKALAVLKDNRCIMCHSVNAEAPFYAQFPFVGEVIKEDMQMGLRSLNLDDAISKLETKQAISEVILSKLQHSVDYETMPPKQFTSLHWGTALSTEEKSILLEWVKEARARIHPNTPSAEAYKKEPIMPIYTTFDVDSNKVLLGESLYFDTRLSANNTVSCATCHDLGKGGTDQLPVSVGIHGQKGPINAPTVFNAVHNIAQFWDGRAADLQAQAAGPPMDSKEMGNASFDDIVNKLSEDEDLFKQFVAIYTEGITKNSITDAIAEYEKTLVTPNAPFDRFLMGNEKAITAQQIHGYETFKKVGCINCHTGEAVGGKSFEYMGIFGEYYKDRGTELTDGDNGRMKFTKDSVDQFYQKTPTLRNVELTPPYFHDASAKTLKEAVELMAKHQVKSELTEEEVENVVAFLESLTGEYKGISL